MLQIKKHGVILSPTDCPFEKQAVLNPAVYQDGRNIHVIYRAIGENGVSSLGYALLDGPTQVKERWDRPFMLPEKKEESCGIEDPRIVKIEDYFYMTYVVHDGKNAVSAFSYGTDILNLKRGGIISPKIKYKEATKIFPYSKLKDEYYFYQAFYQNFSEKDIYIWHKDVILFPEKVNSSFYALQRILPDVQVFSFGDFSQLKDKYYWIHNLMNLSSSVILECQHGFESRHMGGGCPPLRTDKGWLLIYHSAEENNKRRIYHAGAALLDLDDPLKVIARLPHPLFSPTESFELSGFVNNVVFPTGIAQFDNDLYIYYGSADTHIAVASLNINDLIEELLKNKVN